MEEKPIVHKEPFFIVEVPNSHLTENGREIVHAYQLTLKMGRLGVFTLENLHKAICVAEPIKHPDLLFNLTHISDIVRFDRLEHYSHLLKLIDNATHALPTADGKFLFIRATDEQMREIVKNRPGGSVPSLEAWYKSFTRKKLPTDK
jgi:hypothetical protein